MEPHTIYGGDQRMMKKILFCFACLGVFCSFSASTQRVQAESAQSKVTGTLIAPKPSSSDKAKNDKADILPKTGDSLSSSFGITGFSFIAIAVGVWYSKKKNEVDHA